MNKPRLSFWAIWNMSFGFFGIQFGWGLQMGNMSSIYEYLGAKESELPLLWLAAPLTGLIVQPIIGHMSDRTWGRMGRRRPYFLAGAILASLALLVMPHSSALWMAAGLLWILDASVNVSMEPFRAFVADLLPEEQRKSVEEWFTKGRKGIVGLHAALVHQTKWPWLNALGGCDFNSDSDFSKAKVTIDPAAKDHPSVKGQPAEFWIEADWTNHDHSVTGQPGFNVLMRVDETTYTPVREYFQTRNGKPMGADHPIAWTHEPTTGGRFFYTEFGHDLRSLSTPFVRQHILEGIKWAAKMTVNPANQK